MFVSPACVTLNTPLIYTSFMCSNLNMDDFSVLAGPLGYVELEIKPCGLGSTIRDMEAESQN